MEYAGSVKELRQRITQCPHCLEIDPPLRSVAAYRAGIGQVFIFSCAICHKPVLCGTVKDVHEAEGR